MASRRSAALQLVLVLLMFSCASANTWVTVSVLDDWTTLQTDIGGKSDDYSSVNGDMLGGNRDMVYTNNGESKSNSEGVDRLEWAMYAGAGVGNFSLQYDGPDQTNVLVTNGLGDIDLTVDGGMAICVGATSYKAGAHFTLTAYTNNGTQTCSWTQQLQQSSTGVTTKFYREFRDMAPCDFTRVGAIELLVPYSDLMDVATPVFTIVTDPTVQQPTPTPSPSPSRSPGGPQVLEIGYSVDVTLSPSATAMFESQQIDASSISSLSFLCETPSMQVCMYTMYGSPPTQFSFDFAECSSNEDPIEIVYGTVKSGVYYALLIAGESTTATIVLIGQH